MGLDDSSAIKVQISRCVTVLPHEYSFQITHTACLMPMVMETTISCKLKPYEEEEEKV